MEKTVVVLFGLLLLCVACVQKQGSDGGSDPGITSSDSLTPDTLDKVRCNTEQELLYEDAGFSSYTEDRVRAAGVISFQLEANDRLTIYNLDSASFGEVVMNEDGSYFTLNLPRKVVARWMIPQDDFSSFNFDAEPPDSAGDYLEIYVNSGKRLVKRTEVKYTFSTWTEYLQSSRVELKSCNLLKDTAGKPIAFSKDQVFEVTEVNGDLIHVRSSKECVSDGAAYRDMEGWLRWKSGNDLLINFTTCN